MSHSTAAHADAGAHSHSEPDRRTLLRADNITMPNRSSLGFGLVGVGAVLAIIALVAAFAGGCIAIHGNNGGRTIGGALDGDR